MRTKVKLKPGQKGTMKLLSQYGKALFCVRYRYDVATCKQIKTVELIVREREWSPPPAKYAESELVALRIDVTDKTSQKQVKAVGGYWDSQQNVWQARYGCIAGTKLEKLIIVEASKRANAGERL